MLNQIDKKSADYYEICEDIKFFFLNIDETEKNTDIFRFHNIYNNIIVDISFSNKRGGNVRIKKILPDKSELILLEDEYNKKGISKQEKNEIKEILKNIRKYEKGPNYCMIKKKIYPSVNINSFINELFYELSIKFDEFNF